MKSHARTLVVATLWALLGSCGGGTLGDDHSGNGMTGTTIPTGAGVGGGSGSSTGIGNAGGFIGEGRAGFGGDIGPAPGGRGGASGRGGRAGEFGTGGTSAQGCYEVPPPVCGSLCGNGTIDPCTRSYAVGCPAVTLREQCDANDFGGDSCAARGYGSGTLRCNDDCTLAQDDCSPCLPNGTLIAQCVARPPASYYAGQPGLAATDTEVALAIPVADSVGNPSLLFERHAADLSLLSTTALDEKRDPGAPVANIFAVAVAPLPSGWVIAVCADTEIYIRALDATGRLAGGAVIASVVDPYEQCASLPVLAARPGAGPMLLWQTERGVSISMIAADGLSASAPRMISGELAISWETAAATWTGTQFVVAVTIEVNPATTTNALRLLSVSPDGASRFLGDFLAGEVAGNISVATGQDARDVRVVYNSFGTSGLYDGSQLWWQYDATGPGRTTRVGSMNEYWGRAPALAFGDDTVVLLNQYYSNGVGVVRLASDGSLVYGYRDVAAGPNVYPVDMVRRGREAVVGFFDDRSQLYLARITP